MLKKINYILERDQKVKLCLLVVIILIGSFLELLGVSAILPLINAIVNIKNVQGSSWYSWMTGFFQTTSPRDIIMILGLVLIAVYIIKNIYLIAMYNIQYRYIYNNQRRVANKLMISYMNQDYLFHVSKNVAELQRNVWQDVNYFFVALLNSLQLLTETSVCLVLVIFLMTTDVMTTVFVAAITLIFIGIFGLISKKKSVSLGEKNRVYTASLNQWILQSFAGIKEIKVGNKEKYFIDNFDETYKKLAKCQREQLFLSIVPRPVMESVCICSLLATVSVKIYVGADISNFIPVLSVFAIAAFRMLPSFNRITGYISQLMFYKSSVHAVYDDLKSVENLKDVVNQRSEKTDSLSFKQAISVDRVSFRYPNTETNVITKASFIIPKNKTVAFVGPSGSGKTTMADIILGVLNPSEGQILLDDIDVKTNYHAWHKMIGYIPQTIYLIDNTIRANVAFGIPEKEADDEKIWKALTKAQLDGFVRNLEKGLDTPVGDRGVRLSGGQRQRIGIARALYHQPQILVLDEATSALDNDTEKAVMESIDNLHGDTTMIIIAHRLSTIKNCDTIYEIVDGKVYIKDKDELFATV